MNKKYKILIATGGTGGHVIPAYNLGKHLLKKKMKVELISDKRGLKYLVNESNIKVNIIPSSTLFKKNYLKIILSILTIFFSLIMSIIFLLRNRPDLVLGMGGYSSFPVCIASKLINIPFVVYENNLIIGKANKYLIPFAKKIFVSRVELEGVPKKYINKISKIGNIISKEILNLKANSEVSSNNKNLRILVLGGSQAAKVFAEILPQIFKKCVEKSIKLEIFQQSLLEQKDYLENVYKQLNIKFKIFNFSKNIFSYFSKVDLAITRSGSSVLAELVNSNTPFIAVPLPTSADNHQLKNATYYTEKGYSYLINEKDLKEKLFNLIDKINNDRSLLKAIKEKQQQHSDKNVYENVDKEINQILNEKS